MFKHNGLADLFGGLANRLREDESQAQPKQEHPMEYPNSDVATCVHSVRFELDDMTQEEVDECVQANNGIGRFRLAPRRAHKMF